MLVVLAVAGWFAFRSQPASAGRSNVILISIDTCRPDYFGCYGYSGQTTPNIDALAADGTLFSNVITPIPLTFPAHCSMLTGTIPPHHGVHDNIAYRLAESNVTLAEHLQSAGYATAAIVGAFVLDAQFGLGQGFDSYNDDLGKGMTFTGGYPERRGDAVTQAALDWLDQAPSKPFFMFLHYFDPHFPYRAPAPFAESFPSDPYAGEIAYTDYCIGLVLDKLKTLGLYDSSSIIITGDHGESFGEHNESEHGYFIYHTTTKVPLIFKAPDVSVGRRVSEKVAIVDIVPTVLAQMGLPIPDRLQGKNLAPYLSGATPATQERYIYTESMTATRYGCSSLLGLETDHWKYIQSTRPELYDLSHDPAELRNVVDQHPQRAGILREQLRAILEETLRAGDSHLALDQESLERLRQLGYTGGPVVENFEFTTDQQDPKDFIDIYLDLERLDLLVDNKNYAKARKLCRQILSDRPDVAYVHGKLGRMAVEQGRGEKAIAHFRKALSFNPNSALWHNNLGALLVRKGQLDEAASHFTEALRHGLAVTGDAASIDRTLSHQGGADASVFKAYMNLGSTWLRQEKPAEALGMFRGAVKAKPNDADGHYLLGLALRNLNRREEALESLQRAIQLNPEHQAATRALAAIMP